MPINRLEALLKGIGDGAQLEEMVSDLLVREGYEVDPTGTRGQDNGRDALLARGDEVGVLHCSITERVEGKLKEDAEKANDRPEEFDFFVFGTTQDIAGAKRDRLEENLKDEYGWRTTIFDLQRIRLRLRGNPENHDLIREHLHIAPDTAFEDPKAKADEFYESRLERLHRREAQYGTIAANDSVPTIEGEWAVEEPPILAIHVVPAETFGSDERRSLDGLPKLPLINDARGSTEKYGRYIVNERVSDDDTLSSYTCAHEDGWVEAVTIETWAGSEEPKLTTTIGRMVINFVRDVLGWYQKLGVNLPLFVYITLIDAAEFGMYQDKHHHGLKSRKLGEDELQLGNVQIDSYDEDIPNKLREPIDRLWKQAGIENGSIYFIKKSGKEPESTTYEWNPPE